MKLAYKKNKRIWIVVFTAALITIIVIGLIMYNMFKNKNDESIQTNSQTVSSMVSSSESYIEEQEKLNQELQISSPTFKLTPPQAPEK